LATLVTASAFLARHRSLFLPRLRKYASALSNSFHEEEKGAYFLIYLKVGYVPEAEVSL
jgi:hypothetical protein